MKLYHTDGGMLEHTESFDHMNCRTRVKMDDLWECLSDGNLCCQHLITYGPKRYCVHKDHIYFALSSERRQK